MTPADNAGIPGRLERLFLKARRGHPVTEVDATGRVRCIAGLGLAGDIHAHRLSPRQVLVTLASELASLAIPPGALYENMVITLPSPLGFRPGAALIFDSGVEIRLTMFCEPCKRILPVVGDLKAVLHRRGILGVVVSGGELRRGDGLTLLRDRYPALPESARQKFLDFVATIPAGRVVRFADVATAMGVDRSFIRALPGYIKRASDSGLPLHRIVNAWGGLLSVMHGQAQLLGAEGVVVAAGSVDLKRYLWQGEPAATIA